MLVVMHGEDDGGSEEKVTSVLIILKERICGRSAYEYIKHRDVRGR